MQIKRASTDKLREIFARYATQQINGELFMTSEEFVRGFLGQSYNEVSQCGGVDLEPSSVINPSDWCSRAVSFLFL